MDRLRMIEWLLLAALFYLASLLMYRFGWLPEMQGVLRKLGHITIAGYVGYFLDRRAFARILITSTPLEQLRRAVMIAAAMLSMALGL